jgi:hypothetical protein
MKALTAIAWTARRVRFTAVGWGLTTVLACVALSACTSGTPPVTVLSPTVSGGSPTSTSTATSTPSAGTSATETPTGTPTESPTSSPTASPTTSPTPTYSPTPSTYYSPYPTAAPVTGGGGTAGFQDAGLAVLGGAAIVAGLGSIAYRRRLTRHR